MYEIKLAGYSSHPPLGRRYYTARANVRAMRACSGGVEGGRRRPSPHITTTWSRVTLSKRGALYHRFCDGYTHTDLATILRNTFFLF